MDDLSAAVRRLQGTEAVEVLPPVADAAVVAFEAAHEIRLPDDYREFLSRFAGGLWMHDEPVLFSLEDVSLVLAEEGAVPSRPFPYDDGDAEALRRHLSGPRSPGGLAADPAFAALQKTHGAPGCLPLTDHGCNERCVLVISGPLRGQMWRLGELDLPESPDRYQPAPGATGWSPIGFTGWLPLWAANFLGA